MLWVQRIREGNMWKSAVDVKVPGRIDLKKMYKFYGDEDTVSTMASFSHVIYYTQSDNIFFFILSNIFILYSNKNFMLAH